MTVDLELGKVAFGLNGIHEDPPHSKLRHDTMLYPWFKDAHMYACPGFVAEQEVLDPVAINRDWTLLQKNMQDNSGFVVGDGLVDAIGLWPTMMPRTIEEAVYEVNMKHRGSILTKAKAATIKEDMYKVFQMWKR